MRMIISFCLMMFLSHSACLASAASEQSECRRWDETVKSVCPDDDQPNAVLGKKILIIGDKIQASGAYGKGDCWLFVDAVYNRSGYTAPDFREQVFPPDESVYDCNRNRSYLTDINMIKPGNWLQHINLEYNNNDHSAIFVCWIDKDKKEACMLDYAGEQKCGNAKYKHHKLDKVFCILQAIPTEEDATKNQDLLIDELLAVSCKEMEYDPCER